MTGEVVKYHNDFNQVYLGKLNAGELNLAFDIIARVKDRGTEPIHFSAEDLKKNLPKNYTQHEFTNLVSSLRRKFFKLDFTVIYEHQDGSIDEDIINLFRRLTIHRTEKNGEVTGVTIQVDEYFKYLVNDIKVSFTRFELEELFQIRGAYAKKLFRLLKQFRPTGQMIIGWTEFCEQMGVPDGYSQTNINKRILNPAIAELSEDRTVEGRTRPTFRKLAFKKLTSPGSGRKITAIRFTFEPEERALPKSAAKGKKAATAQKACPYAEGTAEWYIWHHIDPVSKVPENSEEDHQIIELEAIEPKQDDKQSNFKGPKDLNEFCEAFNKVKTKTDLDVLENYINENKELFKENLEIISTTLSCSRDRFTREV